MLPSDRVRPTPYDKGFAHPHFLKSFSLLNEIPLHLPHAWYKAKLVLKKMGVGERRQSLSGKGQEISRRLPRRNVTQCSHPSPQRTGKVTDFPDHIQEGIESNLFAAPATSRREEQVMGRQNLRKALCTNHQHQKSVTAIWGPNRAPLIKTTRVQHSVDRGTGRH